MSRLAALMFDAAERSFVLELAAGGDMPTVAGLLDSGTLVPLRGPVEYRAEAACTEFVTGQSSVEARYWSTVTFDPATYTCGSVGSARRRPFYDVGDRGPVVVFDVPHSVLHDGLVGVQVVGWGGHDARFQHPRASLPSDLVDEIDRRFGVDPVAAVEYQGSWHQEHYIQRLGDAAVAAAARRADIAIWLLERVPDWQLFLMGFSEAHTAGHNFSQGLDPEHLLGSHPTAPIARARFVDVYRAIDAAVARVAAAMPAGTTMAVMSPKGMQPNHADVASSLLLPELLYRFAFNRSLVHEPNQRAWRRRGQPAIWPDPSGSSGARTKKLRAEGQLGRLKRRYHLVAPTGLVNLGRDLRRRGGGRTGQPTVAPRLNPDGTVPVLAGTLDWSPTCWYRRSWPTMPWFGIPSFSDGHIRLNLEGRERDGIVALADYERVCDELEARLRQAVDARHGRPIIDQVLRMRADDPTAVDGPGADLIVTWAQSTDALVHPDAGIVGPFAFPRSGSHTEHGFLIVAGPDVPHATLPERSMLDVPPTLLRLLEWPIGSGLTGSPIDMALVGH
ncbi:MAG: hypothetical protein ACT452_05730 [Microthrixaceae bacterium]